MTLHPNPTINFRLLLLLGVWLLVIWPAILLLFGTYQHTPEGVIVALASYMVGAVAPVALRILSLGQKKGKSVEPDAN